MAFSVLAFIALILSICITDRKKSLGVQIINCLFEAIYCFYIYAVTSAILSIINMIRTILFMEKDKFSKGIYFIVLLIFEIIIILNCKFTWAGYVSLLPTIGSLFRSYCLWQSDMKLVRISGITTALTYGLYYLYYKSVFFVCGDTILLIVSIFSIYRNDIKLHIKK